jgi:hypothetical protein
MVNLEHFNALTGNSQTSWVPRGLSTALLQGPPMLLYISHPKHVATLPDKQKCRIPICMLGKFDPFDLGGPIIQDSRIS